VQEKLKERRKLKLGKKKGSNKTRKLEVGQSSQRLEDEEDIEPIHKE
jgi:hypothetical protein